MSPKLLYLLLGEKYILFIFKLAIFFSVKESWLCIKFELSIWTFSPTVVGCAFS